MESELPKLRVRTGKHYPVEFNVDHGQRNAVFFKKSQTPLRRFLRFADAFGFYPGPGWDLVHTVNAVPLLTRKKHIVTFEDYLPRTPEPRGDAWLQPLLRGLLLRRNCVRLIAMSEYAVRIFREQHKEWKGLAKLMEKVEILYPSIDVRTGSPKRAGERLKLCFVGADYMRKGAPILLRAHVELRKRGVPVDTTVVSRLVWSAIDYVGPPSKTVVTAERKLLEVEGVSVETGLPNSMTLKVMEDSDYLVFPTFHDTFGFVSIEAMACGTPVITHDTCAQPEIVENNMSGVLLPFPNSEVGDWTMLHKSREANYTEAYLEQVRCSAENLADCLEQRWEDRTSFEAMSHAAVERVRSKFNREHARNRLEKLYELCR
ncbi:MAG: glycosyltransferase [Fimbriimonadales bacterium]|nr:glycosyltransferase [Fimbriimonadales bacterium]